MSKHKKKKTGKKLNPVVLILALVLLGGAGGFLYYHSHYARVDNTNVPLETTTELDLRGQGVTDLREVMRCSGLQKVDLRQNELSVAQIDALRAALPDCYVRWDIPLGGQRYDSESEELTLRDLDMDDWENLFLFPSLRTLTVGECTRFDRLSSVQQSLSGCDLLWNVSLGGKWYDSRSPLLQPDGDVDAEELRANLAHFPCLTSLRLQGASLTAAEQRELLSAYPDVRFLWSVELGGAQYDSSVSSLAFSGSAVTAQELTEKLPLFPYLRTLDLTGSNMSLNDLLALTEAFPQVDILWEHELCGRSFSSLTEEIDLSGIKMESTAPVEETLPWFPRLKKVVMSECGFSNEEMDALNKRHEDVRFVWTVHFGTFSMRTDEVQFIAANFEPWVILYDRDVECLKYCTDLIALDFGHMQIKDLSFLNYMPHMQYLILAECYCSDLSPLANLKELKYLEAFKCPIEDLSPLLQCTSLEDLNICYIWIKTDLAYQQLSQMTWLDRLWYCGTYFTDAEKQSLQDALPDCEMDLRWGAESTGGTWRKHAHYYEMRDAFHMYYMPGGTNGVDENGQAIINYG